MVALVAKARKDANDRERDLLAPHRQAEADAKAAIAAIRGAVGAIMTPVAIADAVLALLERVSVGRQIRRPRK